MYHNSRSFGRTMSLAMLLGIMVLACCPVYAQKWGKITEDEWNLQPPAEFPSADAVIIFDKAKLLVKTSFIKMERHVRIKVFDKSGADNISSVELVYWKDDKIKYLEAHTILPNGEKKKIKEKFKKEMGELRTVTFAFPNVEDGVILEYRYTHVYERHGALDPWYFQNDVYTLHSEFSVHLATGFTYRTTFVNMTARDRKPKQDMNTYTWSVDSIPPLLDEPLSGAVRSYRVSLNLQLDSYQAYWKKFEFSSDWGLIGTWLSLAADDFGKDTVDIHAVVSRVSDSTEKLEDRIVDIYDFVRDSIETRTNISLSHLGTSNARSVLEQRHGTAGEKNLLLVDMLKNLNVTVYPLVIGTRDYSAFDPNIHSMRQFNHVICCLMTDSSRAATLDASDRSVAYPHLPPRDLVSGGLLLNGEESSPVQLTHADRPSGSEITAIVSLRPDGSAVCTTSVCVVGYEMSKYEEFMRDSLSQREMAEQIVQAKQTKSTVSSARVNFDIQSDSLHFEFVFELPEFATVVDDNVFMQSSVVPMWNPFTEDRRYFPVDFRYPFFKHCSTTINLPEGMRIADVPPDVDHRIKGGMYVRRSFWNDMSVTVTALLSIDQPIFLPDQYPQLKEMFDMWEDAGTDQIAAVEADPVGN